MHPFGGEAWKPDEHAVTGQVKGRDYVKAFVEKELMNTGKCSRYKTGCEHGFLWEGLGADGAQDKRQGGAGHNRGQKEGLKIPADPIGQGSGWRHRPWEVDSETEVACSRFMGLRHRRSHLWEEKQAGPVPTELGVLRTRVHFPWSPRQLS